MMQNRELTMDDYLAMLRRRMKVILIPALLAPLAGFGVSYLSFFAAKYPSLSFLATKYTSTAEVSVEAPKISDAVVPQVYNEDLAQQMNEVVRRVTSDANLRSRVEEQGLVRGGQNVDDVISSIQQNLTIQPVPDVSQSAAAKKKPGQSSSAAFYVSYVGSTADDAKRICTGLTSMLIEQDLKSRQEHSKGTTDFLTQQVGDAKQHLDDLDQRLAAFKNQHMGQLPGDEDSNMKILGGLNSQLDANTQSLNRATQDKSYTESLLAQQLSAWKTSESASNPQTLQQQLSQLQAQLIDLQARYTDDHPDVIKTKADIAQVKKKLAEINDTSAKASDSASDKESGSEPPEIRQLRLQIHQYQDLIAQATRDQKKLQQEIGVYQSRVASSPAIEEEYKELARDYDNAQKVYQDDLAKQSTSKMATQAEQQQQGAQMALVNQANLPDAPSFPNRLYFTIGGLGAGLGLGLGLALWLELRDTCIRTEADAETALELPILVAVPWVVETAPANGNGKGHFWNRKKQAEENKETARV
jgi:polysaccharide chain length determinant protein (PEP-CTERM system associated)